MRKLIIIAILLCISVAVFSQTSQNTRFVAVQSAALKSSTGFFASNVATLSLGDTVTLIQESGKWSQVRAGNHTGWIASSSLSARRVIASGNVGVSASEVALAGKGFSPETEMEYKKNGLDFTLVDTMERITVPSNELLRFITDGQLQRGE
ncbi:MAG: SH3 domain-containing protein [Treponema sp.]|jgi:SH3-like domain-containing protein|nr:SH3 domain-containing protein [Treponema sp.]